MANKTWKAVERAYAKLFYGKRVGPSGKETADVVSSWYAAEIKHRASLPKWLLDAMDQAERNAGEGQLPIVVWHQKGQPYGQGLVVMRASEFADHYCYWEEEDAPRF